MKLSIAMNLIFAITTLASSYSQTSSFTLNMSDVTVKDVIKTIEASSNYRFFYNDELSDISRKVDVNFYETGISDVLNSLFNNTGITYKVFENDLIVIAPKSSIQQTKITGTVTDGATGESLPGVNILIEGTSTGVITDNAGKYSVEVPSGNAVLVFSFVGYNSERVEIGGRSVIDLALVPNIQSLEEVVVIGYGTARKSDLNGSVASVSSSDFETQPVVNLSSALQGRAPGVTVTNTSGAPGGMVKIRIRGSNSINGGNDPLYVVDGIQLGTVGLGELNVSDIESIEILKDASSTAIYGSRGANGVVMITTKQGKSEKAKIDFTANVGVAQRSYKYNTLSPLAYANQVNEVTPGAYSAAKIAELEAGGGTDWQDEMFQLGNSQDYQLSVSGTTAKSKYYFSGRYLDQTGIILNTDYKQFAFRTNVESKVNDKITLGASAFLSRGEGFNNQNQGGLSGAVQQTILWGPAEEIYEPDGSYNLYDEVGAIGKNPIAQQENAYQKNLTNSAIISAKFSYKIFDFLTLDIIGGMDGAMNGTDWMHTEYQAFGGVGAARINHKATNLQNSNILTFHKMFGPSHDFTLTGVYEVSKTTWDHSEAQGGGMPFTEMLYYQLQSNPGTAISSYYGQSSLRSYVGRANYSFKNKYLLTATYRADGSSKFPKNKWGYFPSAALGWRLSEEDFIKNLDLFSNLKARASWGITGNQGADAFATIPNMVSNVYTYGTSNTQIAYGVNTDGGDSELKWEETTQTDFGVDMGFFKNRLTLSVDYFKKKTKDLLLKVAVPMYQGGGTKWSNVGQVDNEGVEFAISAVPIDRKDLSWNIGLNMSTNKNEVVDLGDSQYLEDGRLTDVIGSGVITYNPMRLIVGEPIGTFWGNRFLGIYQEDEAAEAAKYGFHPGDSKYLDLENDVVPNHANTGDSTVYKIDGKDMTVIGNSLPKFTWSLDNTLKYKNFEMNVYIQGVHGNDVLNVDYAEAALTVGDSRTVTIADLDHWTPENPGNEWANIKSTSNLDLPGCSKFIQDGSFVRIRNVSLAYYLPQNVIKNTSLKLMVSAQNLYTFTKYIGFDPEAYSTGNNDVIQGVSMGAYPSARTYTFTMQLTF